MSRVGDEAVVTCHDCSGEVNASLISVEKSVWEYAQRKEDWSLHLCGDCWCDYEGLDYREW